MSENESQGKKETVSPTVLYAIMGGLLFFGTCNTIVMKLQDEEKVDDKGTKFNHPYFQCANMFVGEFMCLFVYFIKIACRKYRAKKSVDDDGNEVMQIPLSPGAEQAEDLELNTSINPFLLAIPASFDICGSSLMFVALTMCAASVY